MPRRGGNNLMKKYMIMLIPMFLYGCAQTPKEEVEQNLLYEEDKFARKDITIEEILKQDEC